LKSHRSSFCLIPKQYLLVLTLQIRHKQCFVV
jgi:hypothetical protein